MAVVANFYMASDFIIAKSAARWYWHTPKNIDFWQKNLILGCSLRQKKENEKGKNK